MDNRVGVTEEGVVVGQKQRVWVTKDKMLQVGEKELEGTFVGAQRKGLRRKSSFDKIIDANFEGAPLFPTDPAKREFGELLISHVMLLITLRMLWVNLKMDRSFLANLVWKADIACVSFLEMFQIVFSEIFKHDITTGRPKLATCLIKGVEEIRPPTLGAIFEPPPLFDGTTSAHNAQRVWITRNHKGLQDKIKLGPIDLMNKALVSFLEYNGKVLAAESIDLIKYDHYYFLPMLIFTKDVSGPFKGDPITQISASFDYVENALGKFDDAPFFLGEFSLMDIAYVPLVERSQIVFSEVFKHDIPVGRPKLATWIKSRRSWCCYASLSQPDRKEIRLGLPSKGRMSADTLQLLQVNPRQYVAEIPQLSNLDVWFQRPKDIVRKLLSGDLDLGIVGLDTFSEHGQGNDDLIIVHEALEYGDCRLSLAIPQYGIFENVNSLDELAKMPQWTEEKPLRVATGFTYLGPKFMKENGLKHVTFSTADGALEAAPAMGIADAILDLVSSGTTLRENNLKEIKGGVVLESQAVFITSRKSVIQRKGVLETTHEMLERLEAHLRAIGQFTVTANMRGSSAEEVAERILSQPSLMGLQGPTVSPVFCKRDGKVTADYYAIVICVPQKALYKSIQQLRAIGGSGVLISPLTYIFDEETPRWRQLLSKLGL
ncbi:ATP phosphoribosyltransferase 2, chloroplastic [Glycine max]|nr:ATP phosphoribosyltransferase 2, chloroplastic [Glycine max]